MDEACRSVSNPLWIGRGPTEIVAIPNIATMPPNPVPILSARQDTSQPVALLLADLRMAKSHGRPHVVYQAAFAYRPRHRQLESIVSPERLD